MGADLIRRLTPLVVAGLLAGCDVIAGRVAGPAVCQDTHVMAVDSAGRATGDTVATFRVCGAPLRHRVRP